MYKISNDVMENLFVVYIREDDHWRQIGHFTSQEQAIEYMKSRIKAKIVTRFFSDKGEEIIKKKKKKTSRPKRVRGSN